MISRDDDFSPEEISDAWGEWQEQDVTQGSEEWVEDQRNKRKEIAKSVEAREAEKLAIALREQELREMVEREEKEQENARKYIEKALKTLMDPQTRAESVAVTFIQLHEEDEKKDSIEASAANEQKLDQRRNSNHLFFTSHDSESSTLPTKEEQKHEQSSNSPFSSGKR